MHIRSHVLPPGAAGSCVISFSCWQVNLPSPCGRTDVWALGTNPGATSGWWAGRGVLALERPWWLVSHPPKAAGPKHTSIYSHVADSSASHIHCYIEQPRFVCLASTYAYGKADMPHTHYPVNTLVPLTHQVSSSPCRQLGVFQHVSSQWV